jgi:hypothetical protein
MNKPTSIKNLSRKNIFFITFILLFVWVSTVPAQETKVDFNALITETQKMLQSPDKMTLVWWIPEDYWRISFEQDPSITAAQAEEIIGVLNNYTIVLVVDGKIGIMGGVTYKSEPDTRAEIRFKDSEGVRYSPLGEDKIDADTKNFLSMLKPIFANMLGPMGENMNFFLFPSENKEGKKTAEAKAEGTFSIELGENDFRWRLPLGSLLPSKECPTCKEILSGAFKFCPFDGAKLPDIK